MKDKIRIITILLSLEFPLQLLSQNIIPRQNVDPIANFAWDENDTSRYEGHYLYEQAYEMIEDMLIGRRAISLKDAEFAVENAFLEGQANRHRFPRLTGALSASSEDAH